MATEYTPILWSDFARSGAELRKRVKQGERFLILWNGLPLAKVDPWQEGKHTLLVQEKEDGNGLR